MKFIINADDFGLSGNTNQAIASCFREGLINRTTIMVNMPCADEARQIAVDNNFFNAVGLHINLVEGPAMSEACRVNRTLCDDHGNFLGSFHLSLKKRFLLDRETTAAIAAEAEAQIQKYLAMGFPLMHADSHQYVHTYHSVANPVLPLLKRYGFKTVRLSRNLPGNDLSLPFAIYKGLFNRRLRAFSTTEYFGSMDDWLAFRQRQLPAQGVAEIMVHPVYHGSILYDDTLPAPKPFFDHRFLQSNAIRL